MRDSRAFRSLTALDGPRTLSSAATGHAANTPLPIPPAPPRYRPNWRTATGVTSTVLRLSCLFFLRWIPGHHLPPLILALLALYLLSFYRASQPRDPADVVSDRYAAAYSRLQQSLARKDEHTFLSRQNADRAANKLAAESEGIPFANDTSPAGVTETLLTGLPNPASRSWSAATVTVNVLLVLMVFDVVLRAPLFYRSHDLAFARVGFVDDHSARVLVREPDHTRTPVSVSYRVVDAPRWTAAPGKVAKTTDATDYTATFTLPHLKPETKYAYTASNGHNGTFTTAPPVGSAHLTFLSTSCIKPRVPYHPFMHGLRIPGFDMLAPLLPGLRAAFMLFLGDFIYIDVPFRLGKDAGTYRREYRQVYASPSWPGVGASLPWIHVIDDHEIANDWDRGWEQPYPAAYDPYTHYHHSVNPPVAAPNASYYAFRQGPASFFMLDTRRHRSPSSATSATDAGKTMLGARQLAALRAWLVQAEPKGVRWKFVVSSVPFTRNWRVNAMDSWAGYLAERQLILEAMWDAAAAGFGVVVLSGDRHEFAATRFPAPERGGAGTAIKVEAAHGASGSGSGSGSGSSSVSTSSSSQLTASATKGRAAWGRPDAATRWVHPVTKQPVAVYEFSVSPLSMFYLPVRTYWEKKGQSSGVGVGGEDQRIAYFPDGNSKVGVIDVGPARDAAGKASAKATDLRYRLLVNGKVKWSYGLALDGREGADIGEALEARDGDAEGHGKGKV